VDTPATKKPHRGGGVWWGVKKPAEKGDPRPGGGGGGCCEKKNPNFAKLGAVTADTPCSTLYCFT